jgi:hypothetical protein
MLQFYSKLHSYNEKPLYTDYHIGSLKAACIAHTSMYASDPQAKITTDNAFECAHSGDHQSQEPHPPAGVLAGGAEPLPLELVILDLEVAPLLSLYRSRNGEPCRLRSCEVDPDATLEVVAELEVVVVVVVPVVGSEVEEVVEPDANEEEQAIAAACISL